MADQPVEHHTVEYKVVPAPQKGTKGPGLRTPEARFANALSAVINEMAADGWRYLRAETLPAIERQGLTGRNTVFHNILVFERPLAAPATPVVDEPPLTAAAPVVAPVVTQAPETEDGDTTEDADATQDDTDPDTQR